MMLAPVAYYLFDVEYRNSKWVDEELNNNNLNKHHQNYIKRNLDNSSHEIVFNQTSHGYTIFILSYYHSSINQNPFSLKTFSETNIMWLQTNKELDIRGRISKSIILICIDSLSRQKN